MEGSFRTNRRTRRIYPISGTITPSIDDLVQEMPERGRKEYIRFATDRLNTIAPKPQSIDDKFTPNPQRYNGWYNYDTWATWLIISNHQSTDRWMNAWRENWKRKMNSERYVQEAAEFAVWKYIIPVAQGKGRAKEFAREERELYRNEFTPQEDIDRSKVNYKEIVDAILEE